MNPAFQSRNPQYHIDQYHNWSLEQILDQAFNTHPNYTTQYAIALAKARQQPCNPQSLSLALQLFEKNPKWLHLIERFAELEFKLVFSFCIKNVKTYSALLHALHTQGDPQHQAMFQTNIENALDSQFTHNHFPFHQLWQIYIDYLKNWIHYLPHRTIFALQKIQHRFNHQNNIYSNNLKQNDLVNFVKELAKILKFHELSFMKKFQLRKFWNSIPATITFLKDLLSIQGTGLIKKLILTLQTRSTEGITGKYSERRAQQKQKQNIILFLTHTSQVSILQQTYLHNAERLAIQLVKTYVIDYWNFKEENVDELTLLENSLIYQIQSDDLPSLIQQLLCSLAKHIPSFLSYFLQQCSNRLFKEDLDQILTSDIALKLCILSQHIIRHFHSNQDSIKIKDIITRLVNLSDSRSELVQIKILKLMHYFREILSDQNFISYYEIIFRVIKRYLINQIKKSTQQNSYQMHEIQTFGNYQMNQPIYTRLSYSECIKILQEDTQKPEETIKTEMRIRKAKFANTKIAYDLIKQNQNWISDKFLQLICIEGYCPEQSNIFKLYRNFMQNYPTVAQRSTYSILKVLTQQFKNEFQRLSHLNLRQKDEQKLFEIVYCIVLVANEINEDSYHECEEILAPMLGLLKESYEIGVEKQLLTVLQIMIDKADMITPELGQLIVYTKEVLKKGSNGMTELQGIIQKLCKPSIVKSVTSEWSDMVFMFANFFRDYVNHMVQDLRVGMYENQWVESLNLAQLFLQTYQEQFQSSSKFGEVLLEIQFWVEKTLPSEVGFQLLMTIHHIEGKSKIYSFYDEQLMNVDMYEQKYSLNLAMVTMVDMMMKNFKERIFQYDECRQVDNKISRFMYGFAEFKRQAHQVYSSKRSTPNDTLPLGKINIERYIQSTLQYIYKHKFIDAVQFIDLKNLLLSHHLLIRPELFQ